MTELPWGKLALLVLGGGLAATSAYIVAKTQTKGNVVIGSGSSKDTSNPFGTPPGQPPAGASFLGAGAPSTVYRSGKAPGSDISGSA